MGKNLMLFAFLLVLLSALASATTYQITPTFWSYSTFNNVTNVSTIHITASNKSIQDAINNGTSGDIFNLSGDNFQQQVIIYYNLTLQGQGQNNTILTLPNNALPAVNGSFNRPVIEIFTLNITSNISAVLLDENDVSASISNLAVNGNGTNQPLSINSTRGIGIWSASVAISNVDVYGFTQFNMTNVNWSNITDYKFDIVATHNAGLNIPMIVSLDNVKLSDYQNQGIFATESGTQLIVNNSVITGSGLTKGAKQYGIKLGWGSTAFIENTTITNNQFDANGNYVPIAGIGEAAGILVFGNSTTTPITIINSSIKNNGYALFINNDSQFGDVQVNAQENDFSGNNATLFDANTNSTPNLSLNYFGSLVPNFTALILGTYDNVSVSTWNWFTAPIFDAQHLNTYVAPVPSPSPSSSSGSSGGGYSLYDRPNKNNAVIEYIPSLVAANPTPIESNPVPATPKENKPIEVPIRKSNNRIIGIFLMVVAILAVIGALVSLAYFKMHKPIKSVSS